MTLSLQEVQRRIAGLPDETARAVVCACIGHSKIVSLFFGYVSCARCEAQIGDTLAGVYDTSDKVVMGHDCDICRANALMLDWTDTFMVDEEKVFPNSRGE